MFFLCLQDAVAFRKPEKWASQSFLQLSSLEWEQSFPCAFLLTWNRPRNVFFLFHFPGIDLAGCVCREHKPCLPGVSPCIVFLWSCRGVSKGVFLVSLRACFSFLQSQPSSSELKISYCYLHVSCPLLTPFRVSDSSASSGLPMWWGWCHGQTLGSWIGQARIPGLILPSYFVIFTRAHRKLGHKDALGNTECSSLMRGSRNFSSEKERSLSKATQQVNGRDEMRIICVTETQIRLTSWLTWGHIAGSFGVSVSL